MPITIDGSGTITGLSAGGLPDATIVQADLATGVAGTGPAFRAYRSGVQSSLTNNGYTKVALNAEDFDTANCFDSTTNYRFTPNVAGYYSISITVDGAGTNLRYLIGSLYKNGVNVGNGSFNDAATGESQSVGSHIVYLNGTTDYIECYVYSSVSSGTAYLNGSSVQTYMSGFLARAA